MRVGAAIGAESKVRERGLNGQEKPPSCRRRKSVARRKGDVMIDMQKMSDNRMLSIAVALVALFVVCGPAVAEEGQESWQPPPPMPDDFDWIQLTSGEWLKGEIIAMYDDSLEFDSKELDDLDVRLGRHPAGPFCADDAGRIPRRRLSPPARSLVDGDSGSSDG